MLPFWFKAESLDLLLASPFSKLDFGANSCEADRKENAAEFETAKRTQGRTLRLAPLSAMARSSSAELLRHFNDKLNKEDLQKLTAACAENGLATGADFRLAFGGFEGAALESEINSFLVEIGCQAPSNSVLLVTVAKHCANLSVLSRFSKGPIPKMRLLTGTLVDEESAAECALRRSSCKQKSQCSGVFVSPQPPLVTGNAPSGKPAKILAKVAASYNAAGPERPKTVSTGSVPEVEPPMAANERAAMSKAKGMVLGLLERLNLESDIYAEVYDPDGRVAPETLDTLLSVVVGKLTASAVQSYCKEVNKYLDWVGVLQRSPSEIGPVTLCGYIRSTLQREGLCLRKSELHCAGVSPTSRYSSAPWGLKSETSLSGLSARPRRTWLMKKIRLPPCRLMLSSPLKGWWLQPTRCPSASLRVCVAYVHTGSNVGLMCSTFCA